MKIDEILDGAEEMQEEMHNMIYDLSKDKRAKKLSYDSMKDIYFFMKISELQILLDQKEDKLQLR